MLVFNNFSGIIKIFFSRQCLGRNKQVSKSHEERTDHTPTGARIPPEPRLTRKELPCLSWQQTSCWPSSASV